MKKFLAAIMVIVVLFTVTAPKQTANADALVLSQLAAAAYAMSVKSGLDFTFTTGTAGGAQGFMEQRLQNWVNSQGGDFSIFGTTPVKAIAAKLAITQVAFEKLKDFINDLITTENIGTSAVSLSPGNVGGVEYNTWASTFGQTSGFWVTYEWTNITYTNPNKPEYHRGTCVYTVGYGSEVITTYTINPGSPYFAIKPDAWRIYHWTSDLTKWNVQVRQVYDNYSGSENSTISITYAGVPTTDIISASVPDGMTYPEVGLDDLQSYKSQDWSPDTNLEQMLQDIFQDVADNNLVLTDETIEDTPETPVPTAAPGDVVGGLDTISGQLEGIDNTLTDVQEGVGEAVGQLEGINEGIGSISEALEVPTSSEAPTFKFDLTTLFPFCIPFDIYRFVTMFSASPVAPHVQIPFNIPAINLQYTFDLDFSSFDSVASVLRSVELIAFCVGLAILTSKVIRW